MALLATQNIVPAGVAESLSAAAGGGDTFTPDDRTFLHVKNGSGGAITVTVVTPGTFRGQAIADYSVSVPATTGDRMIGPFPAEVFADPSTGLASITYSGVTSLTVGILRLSQI